MCVYTFRVIIHKYVCMCVYIYICVCVCVCIYIERESFPGGSDCKESA